MWSGRRRDGGSLTEEAGSDSRISGSCFKPCCRAQSLFVFGDRFARPFKGHVNRMSDKKRDSLLRCGMAELFAKIHHFSRQLGMNVQQDPIVGILLPERTTVSQFSRHVHLKSMRSEYAGPQALPKLGAANDQDSRYPRNFIRYCGSTLHANGRLHEVQALFTNYYALLLPEMQ